MSTSNKEKLKTKKKKKNLWDTMKNDIMTGKAKKKHYSQLEQAMKDAGM